MPKTLKQELIDGLNPRQPRDFDVVLGRGKGEDYAYHYERTQGDVIGDTRYLIGQAIVEASYGEDISKKNINFICNTFRNKTDVYRNTSAVGRFFSYLNPFPNKYRQMRNEIKEAKEFLEDKGMDMKTFNDYLDRKVEMEDVQFDKRGNNYEFIETLKETESKCYSNILAGNETDKNLVEYMQANSLRKFFKGQVVSREQEDKFFNDVNKAIDEAQLWKEPSEYEYDLVEKQREGTLKLDGLFKEYNKEFPPQPVDGLKEDVQEKEENIEMQEPDKEVQKEVVMGDK